MFSFPGLEAISGANRRVCPSQLADAPVTRPPRRACWATSPNCSTRHVAGWINNPADPAEHLEFEVVCTLPGAERVLARGRADQFDRVLAVLAMGDATYGYRLILPQPISEAERDHTEVRPLLTGLSLRARPRPRHLAWQPIRFVAMDIVDNCNLRCPFCIYDYSAVHTTNVMSDAVFDAALRLLPLVGPGAVLALVPARADIAPAIRRVHRADPARALRQRVLHVEFRPADAGGLLRHAGRQRPRSRQRLDRIARSRGLRTHAQGRAVRHFHGKLGQAAGRLRQRPRAAAAALHHHGLPVRTCAKFRRWSNICVASGSPPTSPSGHTSRQVAHPRRLQGIRIPRRRRLAMAAGAAWTSTARRM